MHNGVQLITYADRLGGGDLDSLRRLLNGPLDGALTGVHILPFFTPFDGADAGFDPIDHLAVDSRLGDWDSVAAIASTHDVTADLIVNHISDRSRQFLDFVANGDESDFASLFLDKHSVFPEGVSQAEVAAIYRPRPGPPFTTITLADGSKRPMWTTFTPHQIDIDVRHPLGRNYLNEVLDVLAAANVSQVRFDAVGYAVKTAGTSCFMTPDTFRFIAELGAEARSRGMTSLLEVHSHYSYQLELAPTVDRVYDFALPPLVLHSLYSGSADALRSWLAISPRNAITVLDTHDGIGVVDVGSHEWQAGLLTASQLFDLVEGIHAASKGQSRKATGEGKSNLDIYQVNCTYYSALGRDDDRYLLARLIQFLAPGIPQVYYAGLLAAPNNMALLKRTGSGRDINRPYYTTAQIEAEIKRPVVQRLLAMMRWRNAHPAFAGEFTVGGDGSTLMLGWRTVDAFVEASIDVGAATFELLSSTDDKTVAIDDWDDF